MAILRILFLILFLVAALAVTIVVLLQEGKSAGLGSIGGTSHSGDSYWNKNRKHSLEGKFEKWTKITACVFVFAAFVLMFIMPSNSSNITNYGTPAEIVQPIESAGTDEAVTPDATEGADTVAPSESPEATGTTESPAASETPAQ